jgi:aldose 1-epimerase
MKLECRSFGFTKEREEVLEFILHNNRGASVNILNYGGAVRRIDVPDRSGEMKNVVLGYDEVSGYEANAPYFGVAVGRYAGRIGGAAFTIDGIKYGLTKNNGDSCLHGGAKGLSKVVWDVDSQTVGEKEISIALSCRSRDGEEGFPGNVVFELKYTFDDSNSLSVEYNATTDKATPINLTNHSYFNLNGDFINDIGNHELYINADTYIEGDESTMGVRESQVDNTPFDFRKPAKISAGLDSSFTQIKLYNGYDHVFRLNEHDLRDIPIRLRSDLSGIELQVQTTCEAVVLYSSNFLDGSLDLSDGYKTKLHLGVCLETQYFPNDLNADFIETKTILRPGEAYHHKTVYAFSTF